MSSVEILNKDNFGEMIKGLVLVDFWAVWCGPCKMQLPVVEELAKEVSDIKIAKLDIDDQDNQEIAANYNITSIPTIAIFKNGEMIKKMVGFQEKAKLLSVIEEVK